MHGDRHRERPQDGKRTRAPLEPATAGDTARWGGNCVPRKAEGATNKKDENTQSKQQQQQQQQHTNVEGLAATGAKGVFNVAYPDIVTSRAADGPEQPPNVTYASALRRRNLAHASAARRRPPPPARPRTRPTCTTAASATSIVAVGGLRCGLPRRSSEKPIAFR